MLVLFLLVGIVNVIVGMLSCWVLELWLKVEGEGFL